MLSGCQPLPDCFRLPTSAILFLATNLCPTVLAANLCQTVLSYQPLPDCFRLPTSARLFLAANLAGLFWLPLSMQSSATYCSLRLIPQWWNICLVMFWSKVLWKIHVDKPSIVGLYTPQKHFLCCLNCRWSLRWWCSWCGDCSSRYYPCHTHLCGIHLVHLA